MKHHYVPQFLLRRWCDETGRLQSFSVRDGRVLSSARAPEYTGYESALYAVVANALGIDDDHIEKRFFSPLDNSAAVALGMIERREPIGLDERPPGRSSLIRSAFGSLTFWPTCEPRV